MRSFAARRCPRRSRVASERLTPPPRAGGASADSRWRGSTARDRLRHLLAARAVPALAELARVIAPRDSAAARVAGQPGPLLHPDELTRIQREARAAGPAVAVSPHEIARDVEDPQERGVFEVADRCPRRDPREEKDLVLVLVPDPRERPLIQERGGDVAVGSRAQAPQGFGGIEAIRDHVRTELRDDSVQRELAGREE